MAGYTATPLAKKLGIKSGYTILRLNTPMDYRSLFTEFPLNIKEVKHPKTETVDFIHAFCTTQIEMKKHLPKLKAVLKKDGMIWVSWPKGASKIKTDINREAVRDFMLSQTGLVDIKVAAVDSDWSGLKFVYRQ